MNCKEARALLWSLCEAMVDQPQRSALEDHLKVCPLCRSERSAIERTLGMMRDLPQVEPRADFRAAVWARIDAWEAGRVPWWEVALGGVGGFIRRNRRLLGTSVAAFAIALVGGLYVINGMLPPGGRMADHSAPTGYEGVGLKAAGATAASEPRVRPDYVLREIPYSAPLATLSRGETGDTIYTRYPTRNLTPPGGLPAPTYVYEPVVTPVAGTEPVF